MPKLQIRAIDIHTGAPMSEYQYYEFATVDKPLSLQQQAELRSRSSRATITPGSFINEYHWGDLKGDPKDWMRRYFDAHVYSANWGSCRWMLRLPVDAVDKGMLDASVEPSNCGTASGFVDAFVASTHDDMILLDWGFNDDSGEQERFWSQGDGPGWMPRLLPLRDELLRGDCRPLYLGWLARVCAGELGDEDIEPPVPVGLAALTPAQQALVEFLELDPDWLSAAAQASRAEHDQATPDHDVWLAEQTETSLRDYMRMLLDGRGQQAERQVRSSFLTWQAHRRPDEQHVPRRRVADIALGVAVAHERRLEAERQTRTAAEAERQAKRAAYLAGMAAAPQTAWQKIDALLKRGSGAAYDEALRLTQELAQALKHSGQEHDFRIGLVRLLGTHGKRPAWVTRLEKAGLLWKPSL